jgi:hypothetical protein
VIDFDTITQIADSVCFAARLSIAAGGDQGAKLRLSAPASMAAEPGFSRETQTKLLGCEPDPRFGLGSDLFLAALGN